MAKKFENEKGFLIIKTENVDDTLKLGGLGICDYCNKADFTGYYIAVLNAWYCEECFNDWYKRAIRYSEDIKYEEKNFNFYSFLYPELK